MIALEEERVCRLILPYNLFSIMVANDPKLKVTRIRGQGSFTTIKPIRERDAFGITTARTTITYDLNYNGEYGDLTLEKIFHRGPAEKGVREVAISNMAYIQKIEGASPPICRVNLVAETAHSTMYERIVVDGAFPKQGMYEIMQSVRDSLRERDDIDQNFLNHWMPTFLQSRIEPKELEHDWDTVYAMRRPGMFVIKETSRGWRLYDYEYKAKGGIR